MSNLLSWALWSIVVPLALLSPVIAFLLALAVEALICAMLDAGVRGLALGAAAGALFFFWRLSIKSRRRAVSGET